MKCFSFFLFFSAIFLAAEPPREIPPEHKAGFTMDGRIGVSSDYFNHVYSSDKPLVYDIETVEALKRKAERREQNYYGPTDTFLYTCLDHYLPYIQGKRVGLIGSTTPWYEAIILSYGGIPVTIDYNKIISDHPDLHLMTVAEYDAHPERFEAVLSISSYEHDGLGRYGDPINPNADLEAMEKVRGILKPGGLLFLAVPVGIDHIYWNAHRVYGNLRLPLLLKEWSLLFSAGYSPKNLKVFSNGWHQPVFVLKSDR